MAYFIQSEVVEQEQERAASERALALSDYFVESPAILALKNTAADIYRNYAGLRRKGAPPELPYRFTMVEAVTSALFGELDGGSGKAASGDPAKEKGSPTSEAEQQSPPDAHSGDPHVAGSDRATDSPISGNTKYGNPGKENIHIHLTGLFSEVRRISNCGNYHNFHFDDGAVHEKPRDADNDNGSSPLCDRFTLRTLIMDEMSELFFAYRYVFYCDEYISKKHFRPIKLFEKIMRLFLLYDRSRSPNPADRNWIVFLEDRDRERAIDDGILPETSRKYYIIRLPYEAEYCENFRERVKRSPSMQKEKTAT